MITRKRALIIILVVIAISIPAGLIFKSQQSSDKSTDTRTNPKDTYYARIKAPSNPDEAAKTKPLPSDKIDQSTSKYKVQPDSKKTCKDFTKNYIAAVLGEGYTEQVSTGSPTSFADLVTCTYSKGGTNITLFVYEFADANTASKSVKLFSVSEAKVLTKDKYVLSVSVKKSGKYDDSTSSKVVSELLKQL